MLKRKGGVLIGLVGLVLLAGAAAGQAASPGAAGRIIVRKVTDPWAPAAAFSFEASWSASRLVLAGGEQADSGPLPAGVYSVAEVLPLPAGWWAEEVSCDDGSPVSAIAVDPGETVTCTFRNGYQEVQSPKASLTIRKEVAASAEPDGTPFWFRGDLGGFRLGDGEERTFAELEPGAYTVRELAADGWSYDRVECIGGVWSARGQSVTVTLTQGEAAACTFYNEPEGVAAPEGSLTILKETSPEGGEGLYFTVSENLAGPFLLDDGGSMVFTQLAAGAYTVSEAPSGDWVLQRVECIAGDYAVEGNTVTVNLAEGETAACIFFDVSGDLPYTGGPVRLARVLIAGVTALVLGSAMVVSARRRRGGT